MEGDMPEWQGFLARDSLDIRVSFLREHQLDLFYLRHDARTVVLAVGLHNVLNDRQHRLVLGPFLRDPWDDLQNGLPRGGQHKSRLLGELFCAKPYEIVGEFLAIAAVGIPEETVM